MQDKQHFITTNEEYRDCLNRAAALRDKGARAETCDTLAALEAAVACSTPRPAARRIDGGRTQFPVSVL